MSDGLQDLNLRSVLGGGVGYHLIKRERTTLDLLGGANFTRENYVEVQRKLGAGQVGEEFNLKLGKNTSLVQGFAYFPYLTEPGGNYRTNLRLGTTTMIIKWLGWQNNSQTAMSPIPLPERNGTSSCSHPDFTCHFLADCGLW